MSDVHSILSKRSLRTNQVLALVPIGRSSWWKGCKDGRYPQPVKLGPRMTAWRGEDIAAFIEGLGKPGGE